MTLVLRAIRQNRWDSQSIMRASWLQDGDIVADPLSDLNTKMGKISVWHIEDDRSNLDRVLAALATAPQKDSITSLDYVIFDESLFKKIGLRVEVTPGGTVDKTANSTWHRDVVEISGHRLVELAKVILEKGEIDGILRAKLLELIKKQITCGELDRNRLNRKMKQSVEKLTSPDSSA